MLGSDEGTCLLLRIKLKQKAQCAFQPFKPSLVAKLEAFSSLAITSDFKYTYVNSNSGFQGKKKLLFFNIKYLVIPA